MAGLKHQKYQKCLEQFLLKNIIEKNYFQIDRAHFRMEKKMFLRIFNFNNK